MAVARHWFHTLGGAALNKELRRGEKESETDKSGDIFRSLFSFTFLSTYTKRSNKCFHKRYTKREKQAAQCRINCSVFGVLD